MHRERERSDPLRVAVVGYGAAGEAICRVLQHRSSERLVAVADSAPTRTGTQVAGAPDLLVERELDPSTIRCDVVVIATTSRLGQLAETAGPWLDVQIDVVSICEELGYPWRVAPELARTLDERARAGESASSARAPTPAS
jgi:2,4-diaminopentanoate dehydrogenase